MALVDYSDSDSSNNEQATETKPTHPSAKGSFQKVVDRSNPGKIKVSLPVAAVEDDTTKDEPPTKRAKIGGGAFSSFNSFLPAPKKTGATSLKSLGGSATKNGRSGGLGSGVSLKTGAAPAFSRNPEPGFESEGDYEHPEKPKGGGEDGVNSPPIKSLEHKTVDEVKLVGKPLMFKPLSVARKPQKKKKPTNAPKLAEESDAQGPSPGTSEPKKPPQPKIPLFSLPQDADEYVAPEPKGVYQPLLYGANPEGEEHERFENTYNGGDKYNGDSSNLYEIHAQPIAQTPQPESTNSHSLDNIASDLHLSASERRQLFGRQGHRNITASKVINFNTDEEYRNNEELRATGEQVVNNPVRSIAPGKHSLRQLVNAATSQKDALEESFAKGYSNRKEASGRYGW